MAEYYPIMLDVRGRLAVVIGDNRFAVEKAASLRDAGAIVRQVPDRPCLEDIESAFLIVAVTADTGLIQWLRTSVGPTQLLNVMDRPEACNFVFSSVFRRGALSVSVGTDGTAPAVARLVRERIERLLGPEWDGFMRRAAVARRQLQEAGASYGDRVWFFEALMASPLLAHLQAGHQADADTVVEELLHVVSSRTR